MPRTLTLLVALLLAALPARAEEAKIRVGYGFGIAFLPHMVMEKEKLLEKRAQVPAEYSRFSGSAAMQDAVLSGSIDWGGYGIPALLLAWQKTRGSTAELVGLSGFTTMPLVLLTNKAAVKSVKDFGPDDRIAMPSPVSPQMYALQAASERAFGPGRMDELKSRVVSLPHPDALAALRTGTQIAGYFGSAPFVQIALGDPRIHAVLDSTEVLGRASFLVNATSRKFAEQNPKLAQASLDAMADAIAFIAQNPRRAAEIYLGVEPSTLVTPELVEDIARDPAKSGFTIEVHGLKSYANLMVKLGQLKQAPSSWQDVFLPILHDRQGS
jgi:NitT/TauT family transport system substrate-binding protein